MTLKEIDEDLELMKIYMRYRIDIMHPITLDYQIEIYRKTGFIEYGKTKSTVMSFEDWKLIRIKFTKNNNYGMDLGRW
jgi:hypothetical protein